MGDEEGWVAWLRGGLGMSDLIGLTKLVRTVAKKMLAPAVFADVI